MHQASILNLYMIPDRSSKVTEKGAESTWPKFEAGSVKTVGLGDGGSGCVSSRKRKSVTSPSLAALRAQTLTKFPKAKWVEYEAIGNENEWAGTTLAFGQALNVHPQFDKAKVILWRWMRISWVSIFRPRLARHQAVFEGPPGCRRRRPG